MDTMRWMVIGGLLAALTPAAFAQDQLPAVPALNPAWERLAASNAKFLNRDQQVLLDDLAFATAMVEVCPGFKVDKEKFKQGFEGFRSDHYMKLPPEQKRIIEYRLMVNFGATVALYAAEGLMHPRQTCTVAEGKRPGGPGRFWVQPAAAP
jgi:hypothetical protein